MLKTHYSAFEAALKKREAPQALLLHGKSLQAVEAQGLIWAQMLLGAEMHVLLHPDCCYLLPVGKMHQINTESVRALNQTLVHTAHSGGVKIAFIYKPECMHTNAANAFLKTLEEPGANTYIFLLTEERSQVLPTLQSRCAPFAIQDSLQNAPPMEATLLEFLSAYRAYLLNLLDSNTLTYPAALMSGYRVLTLFERVALEKNVPILAIEAFLEEEALKEYCIGKITQEKRFVFRALVEVTREVFVYKENQNIQGLAIACDLIRYLEEKFALVRANVSEKIVLELFLTECARKLLV